MTELTTTSKSEEINNLVADWVLLHLNRLVHASDLSIPITVTTTAGIITGNLISTYRYYYEFGNRLSRALPQIAGQVETEWNQCAERTHLEFTDSGSEEGGDLDPKPDPLYIHLMNAAYVTGGDLMPGSLEVLWRGDIASVTGFSLGSLGYQSLPREVSVHKAARLAKLRRAAEETERRKMSSEGLQQVVEHVHALAASLKHHAPKIGEAAGLPSNVHVGPDAAWVVQLGSISASVKWSPRYNNSLAEARLYINGWNFVYSFSGYTRREPVIQWSFEPEIHDSGEWGWRGMDEDDTHIYTNEELVESVFDELIERTFNPPEQRRDHW